MSSNLKVVPRVKRLIHYIQEIEEGKLKVPSFQRNFIWGKKEMLDLFDSLKKGYPIGSLLFWKSEDEFETKNEVGPFFIKNNSYKTEFFYILDGFQRLTTLFGCLNNPKKSNMSINVDRQNDFNICYDLVKEEFTIYRDNPREITLMPVNILIDTFDLLDYCESLRKSNNLAENPNILINRAKSLATTIFDYELPCVEIHGGTIEDAVDIFSRINSMGVKISTDWMVSALTYNDKEFSLGTEIDTLLNNLETFNFAEVKRDLILQCIQTSYGKIYFDVKLHEILKDKEKFKEKAQKSLQSTYKAVKFLFEELLVLDNRLLPYGSQLVFISYFFNEIENPNKRQIDLLKRWFWITTYSNYFTIYSLSKQRQAFDTFKDFIKGINNNPVYNDKPDVSFSVAEFPNKILLGSVRANALVLFLLNHANNFNSVKSEEINEYKLLYLFKGRQNAETVIPIIEYTSEYSDKNLIKDKPKDLSVLFDRSDYNDFANNYFLDENIRRFKKDIEKVSNLRKNLIIESERNFVENFELKYTLNSNNNFDNIY